MQGGFGLASIGPSDSAVSCAYPTIQVQSRCHVNHIWFSEDFNRVLQLVGDGGNEPIVGGPSVHLDPDVPTLESALHVRNA